MRDIGDQSCTLAHALSDIGDAWSFLILREAFYGRTRFSEFVRYTGAQKTVVSAEPPRRDSTAPARAVLRASSARSLRVDRKGARPVRCTPGARRVGTPVGRRGQALHRQLRPRAVRRPRRSTSALRNVRGSCHPRNDCAAHRGKRSSGRGAHRLPLGLRWRARLGQRYSALHGVRRIDVDHRRADDLDTDVCVVGQLAVVIGAPVTPPCTSTTWLAKAWRCSSSGCDAAAAPPACTRQLKLLIGSLQSWHCVSPYRGRQSMGSHELPTPSRDACATLPRRQNTEANNGSTPVCNARSRGRRQ